MTSTIRPEQNSISGYGRWKYESLTFWHHTDDDPDQDSSSSSRLFHFWSFLQNRFARIGPVYYFSLFISVPLMFLGHAVLSNKDPKQIPGLIEAMLGLNGLIIIHGPSPNGVGWFVCTLHVLYWMFPL